MNRERCSSANKVGKKSAFSILIASILLFTLAYPVAAQVLPPLPLRPAGYYGNLTIDGKPARVGTTIIAKIGDAERGVLITKKPGKYGSLQEPLWVTGYSEDENKPVVTFWVMYDGKPIKCSSPSSVIWVSGEIKTIPATTGVAKDEEPPVVTDPSVNPSSIPADGTTTSQLNVTVTDNVGVASVTVNLSALGGSATRVMTNIPGTDIYTVITTATVGTAPDTYLLTVNATDGAGNYNDTVSIELEVTLPKVVQEESPGVTQTPTGPTATPSPALTPIPTPPPIPTPLPPVAPTPTPVVTPVATPIVTPTPPPVLEVPPVIPLYVILIAVVVYLLIIAGAYWLRRRRA